MLHVLDTTVLIDYLRGRPAVDRVVGLADRGDDLATTAINVEEVVRGLRAGETSAADALFEGLIVLAVTGATGRLAGRWRREAAAQGVTLAQADCLIAATTSGAGGVLVTGNPKDFDWPDVPVVHWPVGQ